MEQNISRRSFLAGTSALGLAAGLSLAGCAPQGKDDLANTGEAASTGATGTRGNVPSQWDEECDVLVLGAGGAGTSAALAAARAGANVIVLDSQKMNNFSATSICYGNFCVVGSDEQKALGIEDSPEQFLADAIANGNSDGNIIQANREDAILTYAENSARGAAMLKELGLEFPDPYVQVGHSLLRCHVVDNAKMLQLLTDASKEAGADYRFETEFTRLVYDADGMVLGAIDADGKSYKAHKAVLLCTGSFLRNTELLEECAMGFSKIPLYTGQGLTGLGHLALMDMGAPMWGRENIYAVEGHSEDGVAFTEMCHFGAIVTDLSGSRFFDDGQYWTNARTRAMVQKARQEDNERFLTYQVFDQAAYDRAVENGPMNGIYDTNMPYFIKADTIEELAEAIDAPNLPATLEKYNNDVANGGDTLFGRVHWNGEGTPDPVPLDQPPFYAYPSYPNILYTPCTGFNINGDCQVLGQYGDDDIIGGGRLFAAGEIITRSIVGNHYMVGVGIGSCTTLGMLIGEKAAALDNWDA
ncbi:FAD-dependent oxidoreductase [Adlercreutzia shanghongiae]|uniref:FAD-dependent oxidoreductase n=1 Tax=Adlercreutzia shanghongiae TaxID=3111773 RepID=A0ABU6IVT3_9ACTN|nr:FAD-dependent oxidoreductase [Adlercreutzia sp. R22]MEC4293937.1 FAD-dependent oxidoreductase [Adlercreutzia sp. R22]